MYYNLSTPTYANEGDFEMHTKDWGTIENHFN